MSTENATQIPISEIRRRLDAKRKASGSNGQQKKDFNTTNDNSFIESIRAKYGQSQAQSPIPTPQTQGVKEERSWYGDIGAGIESGARGLLGGAAYAIGSGVESIFDYENDVKDWGKEVIDNSPEGEGFLYNAGALLPQGLGTLAAIIAAPFTGGTSAAAIPTLIGGANLATLTASSVGSALKEYDDYVAKNNIQPDELTRWGVGVANGAIEYGLEKAMQSRWLGKAIKSKIIAKATAENPNLGLGILRDFAKRSPEGYKSFINKAKYLAQGGNEEGLTELFTQVGQDLANNLYKNDEDKQKWNQILENSLAAYAGGAAMGLGLGAAGNWATNKTINDTRNKNGKVTIARSKEGKIIEVVGRDSKGNLIGYTPLGKQMVIDNANVDETIAVPVNDFNNYQQAVWADKAGKEKMETEIYLNAAKENITKKADEATYTHKNGQEYVVEIYDKNNNPLGYAVSGNIESTNPDDVITVYRPGQQNAFIKFRDIGSFNTTKKQDWVANHIASEVDTRQGQINQKREQEKAQDEFNNGKIEVNERVVFNGKIGQIVALNGDEATVRFKDGRSVVKVDKLVRATEEDNDLLKPDKESGLEDPEKVKPITDQDLTKPEPDRKIKVKSGKEDIEIGVYNQPDGTFKIGDNFDSESRAKTNAAHLNGRYPNMKFEVVNITDKNDPFASGVWYVKGTLRSEEKKAETVKKGKQKESKGTTEKTEQKPDDKTPDGVDVKTETPPPPPDPNATSLNPLTPGQETITTTPVVEGTQESPTGEQPVDNSEMGVTEPEVSSAPAVSSEEKQVDAAKPTPKEEKPKPEPVKKKAPATSKKPLDVNPEFSGLKKGMMLKDNDGAITTVSSVDKGGEFVSIKHPDKGEIMLDKDDYDSYYLSNKKTPTQDGKKETKEGEVLAPKPEVGSSPAVSSENASVEKVEEPEIVGTMITAQAPFNKGSISGRVISAKENPLKKGSLSLTLDNGEVVTFNPETGNMVWVKGIVKPEPKQEVKPVESKEPKTPVQDGKEKTKEGEGLLSEANAAINTPNSVGTGEQEVAGADAVSKEEKPAEPKKKTTPSKKPTNKKQKEEFAGQVVEEKKESAKKEESFAGKVITESKPKEKSYAEYEADEIKKISEGKKKPTKEAQDKIDSLKSNPFEYWKKKLDFFESDMQNYPEGSEFWQNAKDNYEKVSKIVNSLNNSDVKPAEVKEPVVESSKKEEKPKEEPKQKKAEVKEEIKVDTEKFVSDRKAALENAVKKAEEELAAWREVHKTKKNADLSSALVRAKNELYSFLNDPKKYWEGELKRLESLLPNQSKMQKDEAKLYAETKAALEASQSPVKKESKPVDTEKESTKQKILDRLNFMSSISFGVKVKVVNSVDELPENIRNDYKIKEDTPGVTDTKNKIVYIIFNNLQTPAQAEEFWLHEAGVHIGIRGIIPDGKKRMQLFKKAWDSANALAEINLGYKALVDDINDRYRMAGVEEKGEEVLAYISAKFVYNKEVPIEERNTWQNIMDSIRNTIADIFGFERTDNVFTDGQLNKIVYDAINSTLYNKKLMNVANAERTFASKALDENTKEAEDEERKPLENINGIIGNKVDDGNGLRAAFAWHGSPHDITKSEEGRFSTKYIGTGEGAQAFGWGLYFTDKEGIARWYAKKLAGKITPNVIPPSNFLADGKELKGYVAYLAKTQQESGIKVTNESLMSELLEMLDAYKKSFTEATTKSRKKYAERMISMFSKEVNYLNGISKIEEIKNRNLYKVKIHGDKSFDELNLLRWDKKITESIANKILDQIKKENAEDIFGKGNRIIENAKNKVRGVGSVDDAILYTLHSKVDGNDLYKYLIKQFGSDKEASLFLLRAGIDGIKYPAESKGDRATNFNYVIFDDNAVEVDNHIRFANQNTNPFGNPVAPDRGENAFFGRYGKVVKGKNIFKKYNSVREFFQDTMLPVQKVLDVVKERGGYVDENSDPVSLENRSQSISNFEMRTFNDKLFQPLMDTINAIASESGLSYKNISEYLIAKHALERNKYFRDVLKSKKLGSGMEDTYAWEIVNAVESKLSKQSIDRLWSDIRKITDYTLNKYLESGYITEQQHFEFTTRYGVDGHYVPLRGWEGETADDLYDYHDNDIDGAYNPLRKMEGRKSMPDDPLPYLASMAHTAIVSGNKNKMHQSFLKFIENNRGNIEDLANVKKIYYVEVGSDLLGNKLYDETIERPDQSFFDNKLVETNLDSRAKVRNSISNASQHYISVFRNGEKFVIVTDDPNVARAVNKKNMIRGGWFIENVNARLNRWLTINFTAKNPAFIPVNWIRDFGYALTSHYIKGDDTFGLFLKYTRPASKTILNNLRGRKPSTQLDFDYIDFMRYGGETGFIHMKDINTFKRQIEKDLKRLSGDNNVFDKTLQHNVFRSMNRYLDNMATLSENNARFATYLAVLERERTKREYADKLQKEGKDAAEHAAKTKAAQAAKDITVNFNRRGRISSLMNSVYAFFGAGVQGVDNTVRLASEHKKAFLKAGATFMVAGAMISELTRGLADDDDEGENYYDQLPDYIKGNFMVLPNPAWMFGAQKDKFITIPLPHGFRALWALGVSAMEMAHGKKDAGDLAVNMATQLSNFFSPIGIDAGKAMKGKASLRPIVPTAAVPFYDIAMNEDFAGGRIYKEPFTKELKDKTPASQLYKKGTNDLFILSTRWLNELGGGDEKTPAKISINMDTGEVEKEDWKTIYDWNPSKIEHVAQFYFGGRFKFMNDVYKTSRDVVKLAITGENEIESRNLPIANRLIRSPYKGDIPNVYWDIRTEVNDFDFLYSQAKNDNNITRIEALSKNSRMLEMSAADKAYSKQINSLSDAIEMTTDPVTKRYYETQRLNVIKDYVKYALELNKRYEHEYEN